jgi:subtilase family serine protease
MAFVASLKRGAALHWSEAAVILFALLLAPQLPAEPISRAPRIQQEINSSETALLRGSVHPLVARSRDLGRIEAGFKFEGMVMHFAPSASEQKEIDALLVALQDPKSPHYHQWLTQEQYGALFGLTESDLQRITAWLESRGFTVKAVSTARNNITFSGTASQVEATFQTEMHRYELNGETHIANASDLRIPAALAGVVTHVSGLQGFRMKPRIKKPKPHFTSYVTGEHFLTPADWATIYNVKAIYNAGYTGTNMHVGIAGQTYFPQSDIDSFRAAAGLAATKLNMVCLSANNSSDPCTGYTAESVGDMGEADLDVEWAGGIAQNATVDFIYYGAANQTMGAIDALQYAISTYRVNGAVVPVVSSSYGACELLNSISVRASYDTYFNEAGLQGQTILSAAGDAGSADCDAGPYATEGLSVDWPGSNPNVVSVGGTTLSDGGDATSLYYGTDTALGAVPPYWSGSTSADIISSALQYIPEVAWNDTAFEQSLGYTDLASGGGGVSSSYAHPSWQATPTGYTGTVMRFVPDVAFSASPDYVPYLTCTQEFAQGVTDPSQTQGGSCYNSTFRDSSGYLSPVGGTSASTPSFAGMLTLLVQKYGNLGSINPLLYSLASNPTTYASVFHDIVVGNNIQPCVYESPNCVGGSSTTAGNLSGYSTQTGYDLVTGLGSVNGGALMTAIEPPRVISVSTSSASAGSSATTITITGANFSGSSEVLWNGIVLSTTFVNSTELTAVIPASDLASVGTATITVTNASAWGTSAATPFTVVSTTKPSSISGISILESGGNYVLAVRGANFFSSSQVLWNGSARTTTYVSPGSLSAVISATDYASRPATVTVSGANGTSAGFSVR